MSSTDLVRNNPYSSLVEGIELCHCTIFQSPCSRWSTQVKRNSTASTGAPIIARPPAHGVDLIDQMPGVAATHLPDLLYPQPGRGLTVVPYLLRIGAEPLEPGLARDPATDRLLVAVAQRLAEAGDDPPELLGGFHGRRLARARPGRNRGRACARIERRVKLWHGASGDARLGRLRPSAPLDARRR